MWYRLSAVALLLLLTALLAGCLGGDDPVQNANDDDDEAEHTDETGAVEGRILTVDLNEVADASVSLIEGSELVADTRTKEDGRYTLSNIEPGEYRLQVSGACCREGVQGIEVVAGETVTADMQLEPFTEADLEIPFVEEFEWNGFLSCGVTAVVITGEPCSLFDDASDFLHRFELKEGLSTVMIGMIWDATGGALGEELAIFMERDGCGVGCPGSDTYGRAGGAAPVYLRVDDPGGEISFEDIEDERTVQYRVFPEFGVDFYYQQEFTVHYHLHYNKEAPEGYDPVPDI